MLLLEAVNTVITHAISENADTGNTTKAKSRSLEKTVTEQIEQASSDIQDRFEALKAFLMTLGDDIQTKTLKFYIAFRRIKNFACVEVHAQSKRIVVFVKVNPETIQLEKGFTRDVHNIGHYGTGDLEISIQTNDDLERAKPLLLKSYEAS